MFLPFDSSFAPPSCRAFIEQTLKPIKSILHTQQAALLSMYLFGPTLALGGIISSVSGAAVPRSLSKRDFQESDFDCRSSTHPNPVILLHDALSGQYIQMKAAIGKLLKSHDYWFFHLT